MHNQVYEYEQVRDKVLAGLNKVANPVASTLSPKGANVIFEGREEYQISNDGITIADQVFLADPVENAIAQLLKSAARKTNAVAGDGTSTTILLASDLMKEGLKLVDEGFNRMTLHHELQKAGDIIMKEIERQSRKVKTREDLIFVTKVSANNDMEVAEKVVEAVEGAGDDGQILLEPNSKDETLIIREDGYLIKQGLFSPMLANQKGKFEAMYNDVKVLVTDKRIYSPQEVISILEPLYNAGITDVVIVARDFIGQAPNILITNHVQKRMNILLVRDIEATDRNTDSLEDLAEYLGCRVVTDKSGKLTSQVALGDFGTAKRVIANAQRTLLYTANPMSGNLRVKALREELSKAKDKDENPLRERIARMTNGSVIVRVGGKTRTEVLERLHRYEDAVNAARAAKRDGYVVGGGLTLLSAFKRAKLALAREVSPEVVRVIMHACNAPLRQIAENCNEHYPTLITKVDGEIGYNAATGVYENLHDAGIIEPFMVTKMAWENAISQAGLMLSSRYIIVHEQDVQEQEKGSAGERG